MGIKLTTDIFIERSKNIHGDRYDYSLVDYKGYKNKIKIICKKHGEFLQSPNEHFNGYGCQLCSGTKKQSTDEFIINAKNKHNNKYDYSLVNYINNKKKVKIICPEHGEFEQTPNNHFNCGCIKCAHDSKKLKLKDFINRSNIMHNNKYDYSFSEYINSKIKITIICPDHGKFKQTSRNHLIGRGCPICNESKGERKISKFLEKYDINFNKQKTFDNCKDKNLLPFDFYLSDINTCIEYDGKQHFEPIEWFGGLNNFITIQKHDEIRNNYCKNNNINLLRISYIDNIEEKLKDTLC